MNLRAKLKSASSLLFIIVGLPLVTIVGSLPLTSSTRGWVLITISSLLVFLLSSRNEIHKNFLGLPVFAKIALCIFTLTIILSSLGQLAGPTRITLLGEGAEHLGLVYWLCFITLFLFAQNYIKDLLFSRTSLYIVTTIGFVSLFSNYFYISHGLRVAGLLYHPTSMSIFATVAVIVGLNNLLLPRALSDRLAAYVCIAINVSIIVLTQSRIGVAYLIIALVINGLVFLRGKRYKLYLATLLTCLALISLPFIFKDFFIRFRQESVSRGTTYRLNLYTTAAKDIFKNNLFLGNGPSTSPVNLNNKNKVPEDIAATLNLGYTFSSSHNLFFDTAYYFGVLSMLALLVLFGIGTKLYLTAHKMTPDRINFALIFGALLVNALINIPSIELTTLLFVAASGLFAKKTLYKKTKTV